MKIHLIILLAAFALVSCSSPTPTAQVVESDTGAVHPASHLDGLRGMASGKRDAEMMRFADKIIAKAGKGEEDDSGTFYPGTVKLLTWQVDGKQKYTALRLARFPDGTEAWQGPTPPSGFYVGKIDTIYLN